MNRKTTCAIVLFLFALSIISKQTAAQEKRKLTPASSTPKTAYINMVTIYTKYVEYKSALESITKQWQAAQTKYNDSLKQYEISQRQQSNSKTRDSLSNTWRDKQKSFMDQRAKTSREFEKKIDDVVQNVLRQGGYTTIKTFTNGASPVDGTDITALVLQKLQ